MISIIVPVYKAEKYLHRCVDSILAQSYADFELLLIDDGSPDNSGAICEEYAAKDSRVRVFHKENGGVSSARNLGLDNVRGEWITFVDSDDYIEPGFLDIPKGTTEDLLIQNFETFNDECHIHVFKKEMIRELDIPNFINKNIHEIWLKTPWGKFFKSSIIKNENITFPIGIKIGEDTIFIHEYLRFIKTVRYIASAKYKYKYDYNIERYKLPVYDALKIFHRFIANYEKLGANSSKFLVFSFCFFYSLLNDKSKAKEWYDDAVVRKIKKNINKELGYRWRLMYFLYSIHFPTSIVLFINRLLVSCQKLSYRS